MSSSQHLLLWSPQLTPWSVSSLMRCDRPNDYSLILGSQGGSIWTTGDSTQMLDCETHRKTKWAVSPSLTRLPKEQRLQPAPGVGGLLASHPGLPLEEASSLCARWLRGGGCVWFTALSCAAHLFSLHCSSVLSLLHSLCEFLSRSILGWSLLFFLFWLSLVYTAIASTLPSYQNVPSETFIMLCACTFRAPLRVASHASWLICTRG